MSDLHLEMEQGRLAVPGWAEFVARRRAIPLHPAQGPILDHLVLNRAAPVDLVVLAGDIHNGFRGVMYADQLARYLAAPVVMIAGNHEFYHHDIATLLPALHDAAAKTAGHVRFLENAVARFTIAGRQINVLGCTLWTDYRLHSTRNTSMLKARLLMNDHNFIAADGVPFTPADALARHEESRNWLHETLAALHEQNPSAQNIIVTHHAPSGAFLGERTGGVAPSYGSDMLSEFCLWQPALWIHGHTHYRHDSIENDIRVVSAPRGYVAFNGETPLQFIPGIIDI